MKHQTVPSVPAVASGDGGPTRGGGDPPSVGTQTLALGERSQQSCDTLGTVDTDR